MDDLYLKFVFTDRAGRRVYNIHKADAFASVDFDAYPVIGQIRIPPTDGEGLVDWAETTQEE